MGIARALRWRRMLRPVLLLLVTVGSPAAAQRLDVDLPAGALGIAADALARQAAVSIVFGDPVLLRREVPRVRGRMTAAAAIRTLARLAVADARRIGRANWRLTPHPDKAAPPPSRARAPMAAKGRNAVDADIVVLASKRVLPLRLMAGSVEVIGAPEAGIEGGTAALVTRSTIVSSTYRGSGREKLFLRGIADSSFSGRLQSVTGLYFGDVRLTYSASDPDLQLYDMASVEMLQGPQGTLYGSGSLGGIIRLNPMRPERGITSGLAGGGVSATVHGALGTDADAVVNLPLGHDAAVRAVGYARSEGGFIDKPALGRDVNRTRIEGGRINLRWWPGPGWTVDAVAITQTTRSRDTQYATGDAPPLNSSISVAEPFGSDYRAAHLVLGGRLGTLSFVSATGIASQMFRERFSAPFFRSLADVWRRHRLVTHETRLSGSGAEGAGWVAGVAFTRNVGTSDLHYATMSNAGQVLDHSLSELALFGEGTVRLSSFLSLSAGARGVQIRATVHRTFPDLPPPLAAHLEGSGSRTERWLLPTVSALLRPARNVSGYIRYQEGRRAAAPPTGALPFEGPGERVSGVDAGVRWQGGDGLQATVSVERSRWLRLQYDVFEGFLGYLHGAVSDWTLDSAHATLAFPLPRDLRLGAAVTLNRSRSDDPATRRTGVRLPDVAGVIARGGVNWTHAVGRNAVVQVDGWIRYEGMSIAAVGPFIEGRQGGYVRTGMMAEIRTGDDRVTLSVDNLLNSGDTRYRLGSLGQAAGSNATPLRPLTARVAYHRSF